MLYKKPYETIVFARCSSLLSSGDSHFSDFSIIVTIWRNLVVFAFP